MIAFASMLVEPDGRAGAGPASASVPGMGMGAAVVGALGVRAEQVGGARGSTADSGSDESEPCSDNGPVAGGSGGGCGGAGSGADCEPDADNSDAGDLDAGDLDADDSDADDSDTDDSDTDEASFAEHPLLLRTLVHHEAPDPALHAPRLGRDEIEGVLARKARVRAGRIREAVEASRARGVPLDPFTAMLQHDFEHAPWTTNAAQLAEIGVDLPDAGPLQLDDAEAHRVLWRTIYGLASLGIYLLETNHLSDRRLLEFLSTRILRDPIRDVGGVTEMCEFIDLQCCPPDGPITPAGTRPDGLVGPYELADEDDTGVQPWEQDGRATEPPAELPPIQFPERAPSPKIVDRDRLLPRPAARGTMGAA